MHIDHFKPEAGDPLQQPSEGSLIGQFGAENRGTATYSDFAVIEFRAQCTARLAGERDLVCPWSHGVNSLAISCSRIVYSLYQSAWPPDLRHHPPAGDVNSRPVRERGSMPGVPEGFVHGRRHFRPRARASMEEDR
jgi:hypothetical protein